MRELKILLKIEFKRLFRNKMLYISLLVGAILALGSLYNEVKIFKDITAILNKPMTYPPSVFNKWMGNVAGIEPFATAYIYVCILLAAIPYCGEFVNDRKNQYLLQYYSRVSKNKVHLARFITTFISGGLVAVFPMIFNFLSVSAFLPALKPVENGTFSNRGMSFMSDLYCDHIWIYVLLYFIQIFIYAGSFCVLALAASYYFDNTFLVILTPFIGFYAMGVISNIFKNIFNVYPFSPIKYISPGNILLDQGLLMFFLEPIIITGISAIIFFIRGKNDEVL